MKKVWVVMGLLILTLQVRLWFGEGSFAQSWQLREQIAQQQAANQKLATRNARLEAEVQNLAAGEGSVEERARMNLGLIREGETLFMVVD
ncbi:MAG: septum formation initiator family protein [Gammaproteobacteria bacterium]|nr:septum formation initiator family protein [Gammaproteobacteria bacterium]